MLFSSAPVVDVHTNCLTTSHRIDLATKRLTVKPRAPNPYHAAARRARDSEDEPIPPARSPKGSASLSHSRASIHSKDFHDADVSPQIADFRGYWRLPRPRSHLRWAARRLGVDRQRRGTACGHRGRTEARARAGRQPGHAQGNRLGRPARNGRGDRRRPRAACRDADRVRRGADREVVSKLHRQGQLR